MALAETKKQKIGLFFANPMVAKLDKIEEHDSTCATAKGISVKTIFLLLMTVVGLLLFFFTSKMVPDTYMITVENTNVNVIEAVIAIGGLLIALLFPIIAFKFVRSSMILGTLYSLIQGYALAFIIHFVGTQYVYPAMFAIGLTIAVVIVMLFLYRMKIVKVEKRLVSVLTTTIVMALLLTVVYFILNMFPNLQEFTNYLSDNKVIYIIIGTIGIVISSLFLLVDFEVLHHCVDDKLPKKYEWLAAFSLSFAIIELYLKIFNFIIRITSSNKATN